MLALANILLAVTAQPDGGGNISPFLPWVNTRLAWSFARSPGAQGRTENKFPLCRLPYFAFQ